MVYTVRMPTSEGYWSRLGGMLAAPVAAWSIRHIPPRPMGVAVGGLLLLTNARELSSSGELGPERWLAYALVAVLVALASAGLFMLRRPTDPTAPADKRMARALAVRVGVSVAVFLFVLLAWQLGWIKPTGVPTGR